MDTVLGANQRDIQASATAINIVMLLYDIHTPATDVPKTRSFLSSSSRGIVETPFCCIVAGFYVFPTLPFTGGSEYKKLAIVQLSILFSSPPKTSSHFS